MKLVSHRLAYLLAFLLWIPQYLCAQQTFYKFTISKEGVYHLSLSDAKGIGAPDLSQVAIYGYPGMLPQEVRQTELELQEIPTLEKEGKLYFYASGPNTFSILDDQVPEYRHNQFSDSLSYLIGIKDKPKRIKEVSAQASTLRESTLYQWNWLKEVEINLINSGRAWYSKGVSPGVTRGYAMPLSAKENSSWILSSSLMAQSKSASKVTIAVDEQAIYESAIDPIPNSIYGVKGIEDHVYTTFKPLNGKVDRIRISFQSADPNALGYFREVGIGVPYSSHQLPSGTYASTSSMLSIQPLTGLSVWNIDNFYEVQNLDFSEGYQVRGHRFIVFNEKESSQVSNLEKVELFLRQNNSWPELLIISPKSLSFSAEKLSTHKLSNGIYTEVAYLEDIYNAFGYGNQDLNAIRNFLAWHYHKGGKLKNVLLLGKGTFDYRGKLGGRPNLVPIYTSRNSLNSLTSFSSDDYYGLLEFGQGRWEENKAGDEKMQIGVGRLPVINTIEAGIVVDKIIAYEQNPSPGAWKERVTFVADDGDHNIHLRDSENLSKYITDNHMNFQHSKVYLDRYEQITTGDRQSSPDAKKVLEEVLHQGTVLLNYVGHGNTTTLTHEELFTVADINNWASQEHLALWVVATCDFGRQDSPFFRSASEELLIAKNKGAIGLVTTGRPVFSSVNFTLNEAFIGEIFKEKDGEFQDLGSVFKNTKNKSQNGALNRSFSLIGDPSMKLAKPENRVKLNTIKELPSEKEIDRLSALQKVFLEAEVVTQNSGSMLSDFNGSYLIEISDKRAKSKTLGDESSSVEFTEEKNILFRGVGQIKSGIIKANLFLPKDIAPEIRQGTLRIITESNDSDRDASGSFKIEIGGTTNSPSTDNEGPSIKVVFDKSEPDQDIFSSSTVEIDIFLEDESGINISGIDPYQNLTIQINGNPEIPLNKLFVNTNNSYLYGNLKFTLEDLEEGKNIIIIKAWDNFGNGSIFRKEIIVKGSEQLRILNHKTYPNPTSTESNFELKHNQPGKNLFLTLSVYQSNGQILFSEGQRLVKADAEIRGLSWVFLPNQTRYPAKGTYIYKLTLRSEDDNSTASVSGQIVIQ